MPNGVICCRHSTSEFDPHPPEFLWRGLTSDGQGEWVHVDEAGPLNARPRPRHNRSRRQPARKAAKADDEGEAAPDFAAYAEKCHAHCLHLRATGRAGVTFEGSLEWLADNLGAAVSVSVLERLKVGFDRDRQAYTVPERDGEGRVVGVGLRFLAGAKGFVKGGRRGLVFDPAAALDGPGPVYAVEGMSDVAACLSMGLKAVGRPSNTGGADDLGLLLGRVAAGGGLGGVSPVVVLGENDRKPDGRWPGLEGAREVAGKLGKWLRSSPVHVALPPEGAKDVRAWLNANAPADATPADLAALGGRFRAEIRGLEGEEKGLSVSPLDLYDCVDSSDLFCSREAPTVDTTEQVALPSRKRANLKDLGQNTDNFDSEHTLSQISPFVAHLPQLFAAAPCGRCPPLPMGHHADKLKVSVVQPRCWRWDCPACADVRKQEVAEALWEKLGRMWRVRANVAEFFDRPATPPVVYVVEETADRLGALTQAVRKAGGGYLAVKHGPELGQIDRATFHKRRWKRWRQGRDYKTPLSVGTVDPRKVRLHFLTLKPVPGAAAVSLIAAFARFVECLEDLPPCTGRPVSWSRGFFPAGDEGDRPRRMYRINIDGAARLTFEEVLAGFERWLHGVEEWQTLPGRLDRAASGDMPEGSTEEDKYAVLRRVFRQVVPVREAATADPDFEAPAMGSAAS